MYAARTGFILPEPAELEELAVLILQAMFEAPLPAQRVGRSGQKQHGIDVIVRAKDGRLIGAQTKRYLTTRLTATGLLAEVEAAHDLHEGLRLDALIVITTQPSDKRLVFASNAATLHGKHAVQTWFDVDLIRFLEQYGYGHRLLDHVAEKDLVAAYEHKTGRSLTVGVAALAPSTSAPKSQLAKDAYALLDAGRPHTALARLEAAQLGDSDPHELALLRAKAYYAIGDFAASAGVAEAAANAPPTLLAVSGLAAAQLGEQRKAEQLLARALAQAEGAARTYVTVVNVLVAAAGDAALSYEELLERVPEAMRATPQVAHILGDLAMARERYREAIGWYECAASEVNTASLMRALSIGTASIALAVDRLPLGWRELRDPADRELAERGRAQLEALRIATPPLESVGSRQALLTNLAIAHSLLGDREQALARARDAVDVDLNDVEMWQRWLGLMLRLGGPIDFDAVSAGLPADPEVRLLAGLLALHSARPNDARRYFDDVVADAHASERQRERARYARLRLDHTDALPVDVMNEVLLDLERAPFVAGQFLIEHLGDASLRDEAGEAAARVATAAAAHLVGNEAIAIAALLRDAGHARAAAALLEPLREYTRRHGEIDPSVGDVLVDVLVANRRLAEADTLSGEWLAAAPGDRQALANRSLVLIRRGELEPAWQLLAAAIERGMADRSVWLLEQFAQLSRALGRMRAARRLVARHPLPETTTPHAFRGLLAALTLLHDRRVDDVLLVGTQGTLIDEETSGTVFALAIRQRPPPPRVAANTAVALRDVRTGEERHLWLGAKASGVHGAAPVAFEEAWLAPARGKTTGEPVTFDAGPFAGRTFTVQWVRHPRHLVAKQAEAIAVVAGLERGGVEAVSEPNTAQAIERMREQLAARRDYTHQRLTLAQSFGLPAVAVAELFDVSPREFLQRSPGWTPVSGPGTQEGIEADQAAIVGAGRFVLDPTTLLLLVTLEAEALARAMPDPFVITPQTVALLRHWYLQERQSIRARAYAAVGPDGKLQLHEYRAQERRGHWAFWRRVRALVRSCEVIAVCDDEISARGAAMEFGFDSATLSSIALASERGWALVAEEAGVKGLARMLGLERVTTLQRLIATAGDSRDISRSDAVRWLAGLIELGWSFVALPFWSFGVAARLPEHRRRHTLKLLFSILRTADPYRAAPAILGFLAGMERLRSERRVTLVSLRWLRRVALRALPRGGSAYRAALQQHLAEAASGRGYRALRRALARWADRSAR